MLDLKHPQTKHVLAAARVEDEIRVHLTAARVVGMKERSERMEVDLSVLIPKLHTLNRVHFGDSPAIANTLQQLVGAIREGYMEESWDRFLALAAGCQTKARNER